MRDILSKVVTGSMIAGAALLVAACGGGGNEANNTVTDNALGTDVYNTMPADNMGGDMNGTGNLGTTGTDTGIGNTDTGTGNMMDGTTGGNTTGGTTNNQ